MRRAARRLAVALLGLLLTPAAPAPGFADTLQRVLDRATLNCGLARLEPGLAERGADGAWQGFDVAFCRAVAAAVLADPDAVRFLPAAPGRALDDLAAGEVDLVARHDGERRGFRSPVTTLFRDLGLLVPRAAVRIGPSGLRGSRICLSAAARDGRPRIEALVGEGVIVETSDLAAGVVALEEGRCDVLAGDRVRLASARLTLAAADRFEVFERPLALRPTGPVVAVDDQRWWDTVRWTAFALMEAEQLGVTAATADRDEKSTDTRIRRLLGEGDLGAGLGLDAEWSRRAILAIGNYAELYDRTLGQSGGLMLPRGPNALVYDGGMLRSAPLQ